MKSLPRRLIASVRFKLKQAPVLRNWQINRQFRVERALLKCRPIATSSNTSVLHFSINKAATQYTKRIMLRCGEENGLVPVRMSAYAWVSEFPYLFTLSAEEVKPYLHIFRPRGFLYTFFGGLVEGIPNMQDYRTVVMIRDPRDALVSAYYSYSKSHPTPQSSTKAAQFKRLKTRLSNMTVDEYVMEESKNLRWRMSQYLELKGAGLAISVLKYEDMILDFQTWLNELLAHCQWEISSTLREQLLNEAGRNSHIKQEDTASHRRQVTPGEHKRKLQNVTVEYLNECLSDVLRGFGYQH